MKRLQHARYADEFFNDLKSAEDISRSMALMTSPLMVTCQGMLAIDVSPNPLPAHIRFFCGDDLKYFTSEGSSSNWPPQWTTLYEFAQAMLSLLITARLSDHVLEDITQAMTSTWKPPLDQEGLMMVTVACFYRIMSISTTAETRRLLNGCLPAVFSGYGEDAIGKLIEFQHASSRTGANDDTELPTNDHSLGEALQKYWKKALEPGYTVQATVAGHAMGLLAYLESLIDLALSPLGLSLDDHKRQILARVYANDIGFDLMVDQVVSSGISAFKDCLDEMAVESLLEVTMDQYENMLPPVSAEMEDDLAVRIKKAHDELLVSCMAHADNIIKRLAVGEAIRELLSVRGKKGDEGAVADSSVGSVLEPAPPPPLPPPPQPEDGDTTLQQTTASIETRPSILKPADQECLEAALSYLPAQEQSALRTRLAFALA
ncbi:hypothetical protein DFQ27_005127 [Actinomortierella ambigua]|uniref:Uncharacterized protein n=1 Tax=Actinomortierella ambigua TaxID=1343610 RepID=A0A9P6QJX4_9FUNG|nr:hypothetical protein DFQ27_005127 [Actinomortierella ambigua]